MKDRTRLGHTTRKDAAAMNASGNPLATLLLTAPLLVVPTLAALGLPDGGPESAEEEFVLGDADPFGDATGEFAGDGFGDDGLGDGFEDAAAPFGGPPPAERWAGGEPDTFAAETDGLFADSGGGTAAFADLPPDPPAGGSAANQPVALAAAFESDPAPAARRTAELADGGPPRPLTETAARTAPPVVGPADLPELGRQLRAFGVTRQSLEPTADAFYFGCTLVETVSGATIGRRFEAEAATAPLAVADVLDQVRSYRAAVPRPADIALATP